MDASSPPPPSATRRRSAALILVTAGIIILLDQLSKLWIQGHFSDGCDTGSAVQIIGSDWLSLTYTCNRGAAFGLFADKTLLFVLIALVVVGVIIAYLRFLPANRPWLRLSLGLQLGGAIGNLVDRLRQGFVVDFVAIKTAPVFNLADSCIVIGVAILAYYLLLSQGPTRTKAPAPPPTITQGQDPS
jgi:signal peptidase II